MLDAITMAFIWKESTNGADGAWVSANERRLQERL